MNTRIQLWVGSTVLGAFAACLGLATMRRNRIAMAIAIAFWASALASSTAPVSEDAHVAVQPPPPPKKLPIRIATFSPDGSRLLTVHGTSDVQLWDVKGRKKLWSGSVDHVQAAEFFADSKRVALGCMTELLVWDVEKQATVHTFNNWDVTIVCISADQRWIVSLGRLLEKGPEIYVNDVEDKSLVTKLIGTPTTQPLCMTITQDKRSVVVASRGWNTEDVFVNRVDVPSKEVVGGPAMALPRQARFLPNGNGIAAFRRENMPHLGLFSLQTYKEVATFGRRATYGCLAVSGDGGLLVSGVEDEVQVWEVDPPKLKCKMTVPRGEIKTVAISRDGNLVAAGGGVEIPHRAGDPVAVAPTLFLFDVANGKLIATLQVR
jgi:WD40 repeat protein